eukprot:TRINITY_DN24316_c0_g1_i1.p1 TRINITY_DN24316_c0_g1~~TRINITY_DN24316_c0_g1_i1.p1  ORF type:complete len:756 (+),score=70.48 TRINITY_DN24316_c0_g1_i1:59-2326(+)
MIRGSPQLVHQHSALQIAQSGIANVRPSAVPRLVPGAVPGMVVHPQAIHSQQAYHHPHAAVRESAPARAPSVLSPPSAQLPRNDAAVPPALTRGSRGASVSRAVVEQNGGVDKPGKMVNSSSQRAIAPAGAAGPNGTSGFPPSPEARVRTPTAWKYGAPAAGGAQAVSQPHRPGHPGAQAGPGKLALAWNGQRHPREAGPFSSARGPQTSAISDPRLAHGQSTGPNSGSGSGSARADGNEGSKVVRQLSVPWEHPIAQQSAVPGIRIATGQTGPAGGYPGFGEGGGAGMVPVPEPGRPPPPAATYSARGSGAQTAAALHGGKVQYVFPGNVQEAPPSGRRTSAQRSGTVPVVSSGQSPARARPPMQPGAPYQLGPSGGSSCALNPTSDVCSPRCDAGGADDAGAPREVAAVQPVEQAHFHQHHGVSSADATLIPARMVGEDLERRGLAGQSGSSTTLHQQDATSGPEMPRGQLTQDEKLDYKAMEFIEHLGSGEFGQVFRGKYKGQEVAIKQLYFDETVQPHLIIQDLTREIESFRHLRHKRLVNFIGASLEVPNLCIVTEYAAGGSLHHLLHVRKLRLPPLHCTNMCLQLAEGVTYLHSQNPIVVHRDLKSLNVVLDLNLNLKLCDFGLTESMDRTHITKKNNGGSPRYMAPELFDMKSKITEKVDIWSMACIFVEIHGGPLPYEGINTLADLTREMMMNKRAPAIPPTIPDPVQQVIRGCYQFEANLRPSARHVYEKIQDGKKRLRAAGLLSR